MQTLTDVVMVKREPLSVDLHPYPHPFSQTLTLTERIRLWMQTTEMSFLRGVAVRVSQR